MLAGYDDKRVSSMLLVMVVVGDASWVWQEGVHDVVYISAP